jgi:hypothetical protein
MPEPHLSFSLSPVILAFAAVAAVGFSVWAYRATVPPVSSVIRWTLVVLRSTAFLLLLLIIAKPLLSIRRTSIERPTVLVLLDNSQSMGIRDHAGERSVAVRRFLNSTEISELNAFTDLKSMRFDRIARSVTVVDADSLSLDGPATDIADAFRAGKIRTETANLCAAVLLSDGNATQGANPVYNALALGVPVFTIGVGDSVEQNDLILRRIATNNIAYARSRIPFKISVRSKGFGHQTIDVTLRDQQKILDRASITTVDGIEDYSVTLFAVPEKEGRISYTAEIVPMPGEFTPANNRAEATVHVLRSKMNVLLLAGGPNPDAAFIRRVLESDENVSLRAFTEIPSGRFVEGTISAQIWKETDAIVLVGYPRTGSDAATMQAVRSAADEGKGLFLIFSRTIDVNGLRSLTPVLPISVTNVQTGEIQAFAEVPDARATHAILKSGDAGSVVDAWKKLPPVFRWQSGVTAKPESEVLAYVRIGSTILSEPLIAARNINGKRSIALTGYSLWRWQMFGTIATGTDRLWQTFISNALRWLTTHDDDRRVRVQPVRDAWTTAEPIEFQGQIYDEAYRPVNDATIAVTIHDGSVTRSQTLTLDDNGRYTGIIDPLPEGTYAYAASVAVRGAQLADEKGTFRVGPTVIEFLETRMNKPLLQQIARRTGGKYLDAANTAQLPAAIRALPGFTSREQVRTTETELWNVWWMMVGVILCAATEWTIRKKMGMV